MNEMVIVITGVVGVILTFFCSDHLKMGAVRASALLGLLVGLFFYVFPTIFSPFITKHLPLVFIGASFIGMVSAEVTKNYIKLAIAGGVFGLLYVFKSKFFDGFGGALGALAFVTLIMVLISSVLINRSYRKTKIWRTKQKRKDI